MKKKISGICQNILGIFVFIAILLVPLIFIKGAVWAGEIITKIMPEIILVSLIVTFLIAIPLTLIRKTRNFGSDLMFFMSYPFGFILWLLGLIYSLFIFGSFWTVIGLLFLGVGVVPLAMIGFIFKGYWLFLLIFLILLMLTYGIRIFSAYMAEK